MESVATLEQLIDEQASKGVPPHRIIVGGFSQGCAITLLAGLCSGKYEGQLGGMVALSGYLPLVERIPAIRVERGLNEKPSGQVPIFLARGQRDILVPKRYHRICKETLISLGVNESSIEGHEYEGLGHAVNGEELRDLCSWLEKILPR